MQWRHRILQRSVTERRRLASGRPNVSRTTGSDMGWPGRGTAGGIHPHLGSIRPQLLLPHRHAALHLLDHIPACFERLGTVRRRRDDHDARLARGDHAQTMAQGDPGSGPALPDLRDDTTELPLDHLLVGGVLDRRHAALLGAAADRAEKDARAAARRGRRFGEQLRESDGIPSEVHCREGALRDVTGAGQLVPHATHHVADRGGERHRYCGFRAPHELRVAGEEADANRPGRFRRRGEPHNRWEDSARHPPVEPVVSPRQSFACFALAPDAGVTLNTVVLRSRTWVFSVTVWPPRCAVMVSGAPAWPRYRCRNFDAQSSSGRVSTSPTFTSSSPACSPAASAELPGTTPCTTSFPCSFGWAFTPRKGTDAVFRVTATPAFENTASYGNGSRPLT